MFWSLSWRYLSTDKYAKDIIMKNKRICVVLPLIAAAVLLCSCSLKDIVKIGKETKEAVTADNGDPPHSEKKLLLAIEDKDYEKLESYLKDGEDPEMIDLSDFEPNEHAQVRELDKAYTPLYYACVKGDTKAIEILLEYGADPNNVWRYGDEWRSSPLAAAVNNNDIELGYKAAKLLIEGGAEINAEFEGSAPLCIAAWRQNRKAIQLLLDNGADLNLATPDGDTALLYCCGRPSFEFETVKLLVDNGVDVNAKDANGETALMKLAGKRYVPDVAESIRYLMEGGADAAIADKDGLNILFHINGWENYYNPYEEDIDPTIISDFIEAGNDLEQEDVFGRTPLFEFYGSKELVEQAVEYGVDLKHKDMSGKDVYTYYIESLEDDKTNDPDYFDYRQETLAILK